MRWSEGDQSEGEVLPAEEVPAAEPVPQEEVPAPEAVRKRPDRALLWGESVDLEEWFDDDPATEALLAQRSWEFALLALADKAELPVERPSGSARRVGLRFYLDALDRLHSEDALDAPARRFWHGLRQFWEILQQGKPADPAEIVTWLRQAPVEEGTRSPLVCVFWITGSSFSHYQGISLRYRDDGHFDIILLDLCPPGAESQLLGSREAVSYLFRKIAEADFVSFLGSPLGMALLSGEEFRCAECYDVTHRMDFYLGAPHAICYPWALQQLQWGNSCCPKSLSALLRNEYSLRAEPADAIFNLYRYKKMKGRVSRGLLQLVEKITTSYSQHISEAQAVLPILQERVEMRSRYEVLEEAILKLAMSPEAEHLALVRTIKAVAAVLAQAKQPPHAGSPESWERYVTLRAPMAKATLTNLTHVLANLAVSYRAQVGTNHAANGVAGTVAMTVVHWGDRMIRPVDEGAQGSIRVMPVAERCMLDLRSRICHSARKNIQDVPIGERQQLKRFFKVLADPRWCKAPPRPLRRMLIGESPVGILKESEWASITPISQLPLSSSPQVTPRSAQEDGSREASSRI
jgi:hypothetical protein